eukprot:4409025-Prorocentrum_lima.AAC.1
MAAAALDQFNKVLASFPPDLAGNSAMAQATSAVQAAAAKFKEEVGKLAGQSPSADDPMVGGFLSRGS